MSMQSFRFLRRVDKTLTLGERGGGNFDKLFDNRSTKSQRFMIIS